MTVSPDKKEINDEQKSLFLNQFLGNTRSFDFSKMDRISLDMVYLYHCTPEGHFVKQRACTRPEKDRNRPDVSQSTPHIMKRINLRY